MSTRYNQEGYTQDVRGINRTNYRIDPPTLMTRDVRGINRTNYRIDPPTLMVSCPSSAKREQSGGFCVRPTQKQGICPGERPLRCDKRIRTLIPPCGPTIPVTEIQWCNREVACDEIGAGIRPKNYNVQERKYCCTPMSQYMEIHGEMAKKLLTRQECVPRSINGPPPSGVEVGMPLCRGYYRKHECLKPEDYDQKVLIDGKAQVRSALDRYWKPCTASKGYNQRTADLAGHNVGLLKRMVVARGGNQCW